MLEYIKIVLGKIDPDVSAKDFLKQAEDISELLVRRDEHNYAVYQFAHLSFQEFLAACQLVYLREGGEKLLYKCLGISAWKDVILFYASMVNPTKLIQESLKQKHRDLAYRIYKQTEKRLNLSIAEQKALEGVKQAVTNSCYQHLEEYLENKQWYEADQETYKIMIMAVGKDEGQWFSEQDLKEFSCDELLAIDSLWVKYSDGLYGFSIQQKICSECGGNLDFSYPSSDTWEKFCDRTAWKKDGEYVKYPEPFFENSFKYVKGHLPIFCVSRSILRTKLESNRTVSTKDWESRMRFNQSRIQI